MYYAPFWMEYKVLLQLVQHRHSIVHLNLFHIIEIDPQIYVCLITPSQKFWCPFLIKNGKYWLFLVENGLWTSTRGFAKLLKFPLYSSQFFENMDPSAQVWSFYASFELELKTYVHKMEPNSQEHSMRFEYNKFLQLNRYKCRYIGDKNRQGHMPAYYYHML